MIQRYCVVAGLVLKRAKLQTFYADYCPRYQVMISSDVSYLHRFNKIKDIFYALSKFLVCAKYDILPKAIWWLKRLEYEVFGTE